MKISFSCVSLTIAALAACASPLGAGDRVRAGAWGGPGASLEVTDRGGRVELDCAHGTLDAPIETDRAGAFRVPGTFTVERPGPQREDDPQPERRARYSGQLEASTLTLSITVVDTGETIGPFTLTYGSQGRLRKCL